MSSKLVAIQTYIPSVFSISTAFLQISSQQYFLLDTLTANNLLVVQSAPNVNSALTSWGQYYPSVINVGAWNVDASGEFLGGYVPTLDSIDVYANGLVEHFGWDSGSNFGTSFATPRVSAEIVNLLQGNIDILNQLNYSQLLASVDLISSDVYVEVNGVWELNPLLIMSDDISSGLAPALHSSDLGIVGMVVTNAAFAPPNSLPTGSVSISGTARQGLVLTASNTLADVDGLGAITYQWRSNGNDISSAIDSTYTLTQADVGRAITVVASYTDLFGNAESVASGATALVANVNDSATGAVSISGTARQGEVLTASNTLADIDGCVFRSS